MTMAREYYAGRRDDEIRADLVAAIARDESALKAARSRNRDVTFAVAAAGLTKTRMSGSYVGPKADPDAVLALAEEAHAAALSRGTRSVLIGALLFRAGRRLAGSQPAYARMDQKTRRTTGDTLLIGVVLHGDNPLRDAARQDQDIRRAVELIRQTYRDDPESEAGAWTWSLLRAIDPDEAARMARTYLQDESTSISRAIRRRVEPMSASTALTLYWAAEMEGKRDEGLAIIKEYAARGVPLPIGSP
jgi:hypothetical protein